MNTFQAAQLQILIPLYVFTGQEHSIEIWIQINFWFWNWWKIWSREHKKCAGMSQINAFFSRTHVFSQLNYHCSIVNGWTSLPTFFMIGFGIFHFGYLVMNFCKRVINQRKFILCNKIPSKTATLMVKLACKKAISS